MEWGRIVVPLAGMAADAGILKAAARIAQRFEAELLAAYCPPDLAELTPWLGEGYAGGVQIGAIESLQAAAAEGQRAARATLDACDYPRRRFEVLSAPIWQALAIECRLADLVVFGDRPARGEGPFGEAFQQVLIEERAATMVVRGDGPGLRSAVVAWDGGEPASRAARRAVPLLRMAERVTVVGAPDPARGCDLSQLRAYYEARGLKISIKPLARSADMAPLILEAAEEEGADLLVAGAFGRSRLREFIFGGTTRALLHSPGPTLFLAH